MSDPVSARPVRLLVVEDDLIQVELIQHALRSVTGIEAKFAATGRQGLQYLLDWRPEILMVDLYLPDMRGLDILAQLRSQKMACTVFVSSATESVSEAIEAVREGAAEFLAKPLDVMRFQGLLRGAVNQITMMRGLDAASETRARASASEMVSDSPVMKHMMTALRAAARGKSPVLISGERGTGRELAARQLHSLSGRAAGPFVVLQTEEARGGRETAAAFARAIVAADSGTLYIPELRSISTSVQKALLAFLENQRVDGVERPLSVRIVAAIDDSIPPGNTTLAVDPRLLSMIRMVTIAVPPLRVRGEDILHVAENALRREAALLGVNFHAIDGRAQKAILGYTWPGNVDELIQTMGAVMQTHRCQVLEIEHLPARIQDVAKDQTSAPRALSSDRPRVRNIKPLWQVEKEAIEAALDAFDGDVLEAARALQTSPATIYRKQKLWAQEQAVQH